MIDTGHHPDCVCGSCSSIRRECEWPQPRAEDGTFGKKIERWGHNWLSTGRGNLLHCDHCGKDGLWGIQNRKLEDKNLILSVELVP